MTTTTTLAEKEFYDITVVMAVFFSFLVLVSQCAVMVSSIYHFIIGTIMAVTKYSKQPTKLSTKKSRKLRHF